MLLASGATQIYAVDVGHDQLHPKLQRDSRVIRRDGVNARDIDPPHIVPQPPGAISIDVSFIGLRLVLPSVLVAAPGAWLVALVKPQFEVGVTALGKGGIVRDQEARKAALDEIVKFLNARPLWTVLGTMESPSPAAAATWNTFWRRSEDDPARSFSPPIPSFVAHGRRPHRSSLLFRSQNSSRRNTMNRICKHFGSCGGCALQNPDTRGL